MGGGNQIYSGGLEFDGRDWDDLDGDEREDWLFYNCVPDDDDEDYGDDDADEEEGDE